LRAAGEDRRGTTGEAGPAGVDHRRRRIAVALVVAVAVVVLDQVTKSLAVSKLSSGPVHLIGPFSLALSYNTGVAFSIGTGLTLPIVVIVVVVVTLVAWFGRAVPSTAAAVGLGMILGGAVGNLADRLFRGHHGAVVDFVYSGFWPTFNLADASIVLGCVVLGVSLWRSGATRHRPENEGGGVK
jgi:signal peptidase II